MKLSKATLVVPLAGLLVIVAAGAVLASTASSSGVQRGAVAPAAASPTPAPSTAAFPRMDIEDTALADALDGLVTKGTITAAQKTAILDAVTAERTTRQAQRQADRAQILAFLADGQITQDELDKLPADSPLRQLTGVMDDGKITLDELRGIGRGVLGGMMGGKGMGGGRGGMKGGHAWGNGAAPSPSASPTTGG